MQVSDDIKLLYSYSNPYRKRLVVIAALAIVCAGFEAINLGALVPLLQLMNSDGAPSGMLWNFLSTVFSLVGLPLNFLTLILVLAFLFLIGQVLQYVRKTLQTRLWFTASSDMKNRIFRQALETDIGYHYTHKSGSLINLLTHESERSANVLFVLTELLTYCIFICIYLGMLLYISVPMTLLCLIIAVSALLLLNAMIVRSQKMGTVMVETNMLLNEFINEHIGMVKLIKIFAKEDREAKKFEGITGAYARNNSAFMMNGVKIETLFQIIIFLIAIMILIVSTLVIQMQLPLLLVFLFILIRLTDPLRQFNAQRHQLAGDIASLRQIDDTLSELRTALNITNGGRKFSGFTDAIVVDRVDFSYSPDTPVLKDISLSIRKNKMVAIVGASGSGKSTLVDLIIRLMDPGHGVIKVDGADLREYELSSYRARIGFVSQDCFIFNTSVLENITYSSDTGSREEAIRAATAAHAHDFIMKLPEGYDTLLGERGVMLSGGERQRISLARALYRNPDILILDEATSALDSESERIIQDSIREIRSRCTILIIAHRLSTIEMADEILVMENGSIVERGTSGQLLNNRGSFARFHALQHGGTIP